MKQKKKHTKQNTKGEFNVSDVSNAVSLWELKIDDNLLSGEFDFYALPPSLSELKISDNLFNGSNINIPPHLSQLTVFEIKHNFFVGTFGWNSVINFGDLTSFDIAENDVSNQSLLFFYFFSFFF